MAESNVELAKKLEEKVSMLVSRYKDLKNKLSHLEEENIKLNEKLQVSAAENEELERKFENYRLSMAIGNNSNTETSDAKKRINQIVREIDKCIALLNR